MTSIKHFIKGNAVLSIACLAAIVTSIFIHPDKTYITYFDFKTITCLFLTLAVISALKDIDFFSILAKKIVMMTGNLRVLTVSLVYITFIGSMLIANDMALITFLPLGYYSLSTTKNEKYMAYVFILQNISANLGGMLTPFGNPQNLYLYSYFNIPTKEFMKIMFPPFVLAIVMLTLCCFLVKPIELKLLENEKRTLEPIRTTLYTALFIFSLLIVFRLVEYWIGLVLIPVILFFVDKKALKDVDYGLLFTFIFFFVFAGNMSRIDSIHHLLQGMLDRQTLLVSEFSCQVISNVPSSILLSRFTDNYRELLLGVNIGGTGTLISSLASLITFNHYRAVNPGNTKQYLGLFTLMNVVFLGIMTAVTYFVFL